MSSFEQTNPRMPGLRPRLYASILGAAAIVLAGPPAASQARTESSPANPVIVAAGEIAGKGRGDSATAKLLDRLAPSAVLTLGDSAAPRGTDRQFRRFYRPTWGRHKGKTRPVAGDRDYRVKGARGHFEYFGKAAGRRKRGYYGYDLGSWHLIALNSNCGKIGGCAGGSAQERWLRADLAAHPNRCTLAYWHHPRFTSGSPRGGARAVAPLWRALHDAGADVVLNAHSRSYERFAPQDPGGRADRAGGIRQFVVGTGGQRLSRVGRARPHSEVRHSRTHGVLRMTLAAGRYEWRFVPQAGKTFTDSGAANCHSGSAPSVPSPASSPSSSPASTAIASPEPSPAPPQVVAIAGDIAGGDAGPNDEATAKVVESIDPVVALTAGDNAYPDGTLANYMEPGSYADTWGRFKAKTRPVPGNHEYHDAAQQAPGYFDYFNGVGNTTGPAGERGKGYYSFDVGAWHLVALNSNISMSASSPQTQWLRQDLAANPGCTLAYWHHPRFTSGVHHSGSTWTKPIWDVLYEHGADVVVAGHNHNYERFAPQDPDGRADPVDGIREFVSGAGGAGLYGFSTTQPNSEVRNADTHGVLKLTLHRDRYDWQFVPVAGKTFTDTGSSRCHSAEPAPEPEPPAGRYPVRGMIDRDFSGTGYDDLTALGFNYIDSTPSNVNTLTGDLKGLVWVGDYDNGTCDWQVSDGTLTARVTEHKDNPKVGAWFISDEPDPFGCPSAYAQHKARVALINGIDPGTPVLTVLDSNSGQASLDQMQTWAANGDVFGMDPYTCLQGASSCAFEWIDRLAAEADRVGMRYWAMVQAFGEPDGSGPYMVYLDAAGGSHSGRPRLPTPAEMHEQFEHWRATRMEGYLAFAWKWPDGSPAVWLANQPALQQQLAVENGS